MAMLNNHDDLCVCDFQTVDQHVFFRTLDRQKIPSSCRDTETHVCCMLSPCAAKKSDEKGQMVIAVDWWFYGLSDQVTK